MKPSQLYERLKAYAPDIHETTLCDIHKDCQTVRRCKTPSAHRLLDLDKIKEHYCSVNKMKSLASADGLTYNKNDVTCFLVEMKSWANVLEDPHTHSQASTKKIDKAAAKYKEKLEKKIQDSSTICQGIIGDNHLFDTLPLSLVFVTDIDTRQDPIKMLQYNLNQLAATASPLYCNEKTKELLSNIQNEKPEKPEKPVKTYYTSCRDFDKDIEQYT